MKTQKKSEKLRKVLYSKMSVYPYKPKEPSDGMGLVWFLLVLLAIAFIILSQLK